MYALIRTGYNKIIIIIIIIHPTKIKLFTAYVQ